MKYEKAIAELQGQLHPGEQILSSTKASLRQADDNRKNSGKQGDVLPGAAALTAARLMFAGSMLLQKQSFSIPLASIVSVDSHRQAFVTYTVVTVQGGAGHRFVELPGDFRAAIDKARFAQQPEPPRPSPLPTPAVSAGGVDQLGQLAGMHQAGVLTDAEFTAAKARLLGL